MLTVTQRAHEAVRAFTDTDADAAPALRITLHEGSPLAPRYGLALVDHQQPASGEVEVGTDGLRIFVDQTTAARFDGATVDFVETDAGSGFEIRGLQPAVEAHRAEGPLAERVRRILDEQVNPGIAAHGGAINLASVNGTEIAIEMTGGCQGCAMSRMTLRQGVERMLRDSVPEITAIHDVTDHNQGENPYYRRTDPA